MVQQETMHDTVCTQIYEYEIYSKLFAAAFTITILPLIIANALDTGGRNVA